MAHARIFTLGLLAFTPLLLSAQSNSKPLADSLAPRLQLRQIILDGIKPNAASPTAFPAQHRALFCRLDDQLDRSGIPLRVRLGSLDYVNTLEQKAGYRLGQ